MESITLEELKEKLDAGESIDEIAKKYRFNFHRFGVAIPNFISMEQLVEIAKRAPELFVHDNNIPVWVFFLLLLAERFDIVDSVVSNVFYRGECLLDFKKEDISDPVVCKNVSVIKQVTKKQILMWLSIIEKRKNLLPNFTQDYITNFIIENLFEPCKRFFNEEAFMCILDWVTKETDLYFFKNISSAFMEQLPVKNQRVQEKLVKYFIAAHPAWIFNPYPNKNNFFMKKEKAELLDKEFFISSVVKSFSKLSTFKKIYLLNFPYFIENYPQQAIESLRNFITNKGKFIKAIFKGNNIFIPDKIWDILNRNDPLLLTKLIKELPAPTFSFNINYVSDKAKLACFINPESSEEVHSKLGVLKGLFSDDPTHKIIKRIKEEAYEISSQENPQQIAEIIKFLMDKAPYDIAFWILHILVPRGVCFDRLVEEELEHKLGSVKEQLKEILAYLEKEKQSNTIK